MSSEYNDPPVSLSRLAPAVADDNVIQSFQLEKTLLRGRVVRMGQVLGDILSAHDYPEAVAHLVAETAMLACLLSSMLKYEGVFTLQASGDGPVRMLVADVTHACDVRACASFDAERLQHAEEQLQALTPAESSQNHLAQYIGKGYIAFTVDQGGGPSERYQGIVELKGASLVDCVQHYFNQSEQIVTGIKMAVGRRGGHWRAGGIMLQKIPHEGGTGTVLGNMDEDGWRRSMILMSSATNDELLESGLHSHALLYRLFHEEEVRVFAPRTLHKGCRCSEEKVRTIIDSLSEEDREFMTVDGKIVMHCEFCSRDFILSEAISSPPD